MIQRPAYALWMGTARRAEAALGPWLELAIRLWVAQAYLAVQVRAMMGGGGAGHPVATAWDGVMHAVVTSDAGAAVQAVCPILLAAGLLARPAAAAMVLQAVLLPVEGDTGLFWAALLLRVVMVGAGPLSIDRALHAGAESLAIPGVAAVRRGLDRWSVWMAPVYQSGLRLWLAAAPAGVALAALSVTNAMLPGAAGWLPHVPPMVAGLGAWPALVLGVMLAVGFGTRLAAVLLLALVPFGMLGASDARLYWALLLATVALRGPGRLAADGWIGARLLRRGAAPDRSTLPHVVVVGGGFGGIAAVLGLRDAACRITLIDRRNHHLFQPLLYQVATAGLSPADIATPVRSLVRGQDNVRVLLGAVTGVDTVAKTVRLDRAELPYDLLVLATGARHSYFGRDEWAEFAPGLKSIEDATDIRRRLLIAFEEAEGAASEAERSAWLTFVVVGGGPTGVELAGAIAELARHGLDQEFRSIVPADAHVLLLQSGKRLLPAFPEALSAQAERALRHLGVDVRVGCRVEAVDGLAVVASGEVIPARTVLWAAGVMASPAAAWLGVEADRAGRVPVGGDLGVAGVADVFVVGDTAASMGWAGREVPGLAPAAKQGGAYVARVIGARLRGRAAPGAFRYRHFGSLATIGRQSAVADFGVFRVSGALAWWLWGAAHVVFLVGGRNRMVVLVQWLWAYLTFNRGSRLITNDQ